MHPGKILVMLLWGGCCALLMLALPEPISRGMGPFGFALLFLVGAALIPSIHIRRKEKS